MKLSFKKTLLTTGIVLACLTTTPALAHSDSAKGLNVIVTSADTQTQLMAMVLSLQTIKKHKKSINMVLCGPAGKLGLKDTVTDKLKPQNVSPTMLLNKIMKLGANVKVCPLYLPNANKTKADLIPGITVAKPPKIAGNLLNKHYNNLTY
jgi:hypothetical protein